MKQEGSYIFVFFTNEYTFVAFAFTWFSFVSLNKTSLLNSNLFLSKPASNRRKTSKGWGCVEKGAETKLGIQSFKTTYNNKKIKTINHCCTCKLPSLTKSLANIRCSWQEVLNVWLYNKLFPKYCPEHQIDDYCVNKRPILSFFHSGI